MELASRERVCEDFSFRAPQAPTPVNVATMPLKKGFQQVSLSDIFSESHCTYATRMCTRLSAETRAHLRKLSSAGELLRVSQDKSLVALRKSGNFPKCEVREVVSLHHPARWYATCNAFVLIDSRFAPPTVNRCFALAATKVIQKNEYFGFYIGNLMELSSVKEDDTQVLTKHWFVVGRGVVCESVLARSYFAHGADKSRPYLNSHCVARYICMSCTKNRWEKTTLALL